MTKKNLGKFLLIAALILSASACFLLTELGQLIDAPRGLLLTLFANKFPYSALTLSLLVIAIILNYTGKFINTKKISVLSGLVCFMLAAAFYIMPYFFFPTHQYDAEYRSVQKMEPYLSPDDDVLVLDVNGEAHAYPTKMLWQPHIAGASVGGSDIAMTYCVLTNSGVAFSPVLNNKKMELKVLMQNHNNLVFYDDNSGDTVQQLSRQTDFSQQELKTYPVQMMPWNSYKHLYPEGNVFFNPYDTIREKLVNTLMSWPLDGYSDLSRNDPMFPTLDVEDDRLPNKEKIWALEIDGNPLAISREYFTQNNLINTELGGKSIIIAYFPEFQTAAAFAREYEVTEIDVYGNTPQGKLERIELFSEIYWMIWVHFYPGTLLLS